MDYYMVVEIEEKYGTWVSSPETFDLKSEAKKYKAEQEEKNPGKCFVLCRVEEIT